MLSEGILQKKKKTLSFSVFTSTSMHVCTEGLAKEELGMLNIGVSPPLSLGRTGHAQYRGLITPQPGKNWACSI